MAAMMSPNVRRPLSDQLIMQVSYESNITSRDAFYTDSNGREMLKRVRDYRPTWKLEVNEPVSGNYYPLTAGMYLKVNSPQGHEIHVCIVLTSAADQTLLRYAAQNEDWVLCVVVLSCTHALDIHVSREAL